MVAKKNDLFSIEKRNKDSVESYTTELVPCITKLPLRGSDAPFKFLIKSIKGEFIDPNNILLYLQFKLWRKGTDVELKNLEPGENVAPYNGFLYTMFKDITIDFNGVTVYTTHQQYQHLAYLSLLLHAPHSTKDTLFTSALWKADNPGAFNLVNLALATLNKGSYERANRVDKSTTCELKGQVLVDCLKVHKPILDGLDIGLNFFMHDPKSCILANWPAADPKREYIIEILEAKLEVGRIRPKQMTISHFIYPYVHRDLLHMIHEKSLSYFGPVTIASGVLPKRVIVGLLTETAYNGNYKENRLSFMPHKVDNVVVRVNSVDKPYRGGYLMDYKKNFYMDAYYGLFKELGQTTGGSEIGPFTYEQYDAGYTLYAFDTSPDHSASSLGYGKIGSGSCELMIHFKETPLDDNIVILEDEDTKIRTVCVSAGESNKLQLVNITDGARSAVRKSLKKWVGEEKIKNDLCEIILKGKPWRQENTEEVNTSRTIMLRVIGALHNAGFPFYGSFGAKEQIDTLFFQERELPENEESFFMISLHGRNKLRLFEVEDELADALKEFLVKTWQDGIDRFRTHEKEGYTEIKLAGGLWLDDSGRMVLDRVFEWMADKGWALYCSFEVAPFVSEKCCLVFRKTEPAKATFICVYPVYDNKIHICGASGKLKDQIVENITKHWPTISDKGWIQQGENQYAVSDIFQVTLLGNPWAGRDRDQSLMARHLMMAIMIELQGLGLTLAASASLMCFEGSDPESDEAVTLDALFFTDYSDKQLDFNQQERGTKWAEALPEPKHFTEEEADAAMANYLLQKELR